MKKMMIIAAMALFVALGAHAQTDSSEQKKPVYEYAEEMPTFPGGPQALFQFLAENIKYPEADKKADVKGLVVVEFTISTDGTVKNARVVKHATEAMDKEALRVTNLMPRWKPGKKQGKAVDVKYNLPFKFGTR